MRISDWSSDVCSSDLLRQRARLQIKHDIRTAGRAGGIDAQLAVRNRDARLECAAGGVDEIQRGIGVRVARKHCERDSEKADLRQDRKSVVEGKSESERVDHGGRRSLNKQKKIR